MRQKRVLLLIETSRSFGRGCIRGIAAYIRSHEPWDIFQHERSSESSVPKDIEGWAPDGVIARIENKEVAESILGLGIPAVDLRCHYRLPGIARMTTSGESCTERAVEHFLERGYTRFAYCGYPGIDFSEDRARFFRRQCKAKGIDPIMFSSKLHRIDTNVLQLERRGDDELERLSQWLLKLPQPIAILACNDVRGRQLITAARMAHVEIPSDMAVLGIDDDDVLCELSAPPLSSVSPNARQLGFKAAGLLDSMMGGASVTNETIYIPAGRVSARQSTDCIAVDDLAVSKAMSFIRDHGCEAIAVANVVLHAGVSRATLDRRFVRFIGHSPSQEILRVRIARTKQLLTDTDYSLEQIAEMVSVSSAAHLIAAFKRYTSVTPGEFRKMWASI